MWLSRRAAIGHRRLAVIDLEGGAQPMAAHRDGDVVLTFSGEIYNFRSLREELRGHDHEFATRSDTEVLLRAYLQWGTGCPEHLNGMFAFAVWDERSSELFLARDRLGIKPLYYAELPSGLLFGSEPKAVLAHPLFRPELDADGIARLFAQVGTTRPGPTVYRGLREVRPATTVRRSAAGLRETTYWRLPAHPHTDDPAATTSTVRQLLEEIVDMQSVSDVPLCSLLSGGVDSSALSALAARNRHAGGGGRLSSFSVDFAGSRESFVPDRMRPSHDEAFARQAAEHIGSRHVTVQLHAEDLVRARFAPLAAHDMPSTGDMFVSIYLLFAGVREQATVALSGESADEVFGGYHWFHVPALRDAPTYPWAVNGSWAPLLTDDVRERAELDRRAGDEYADARAEVPRLTGEDPLGQRVRETLYLGLTRWLPMLLDRKDRLSMAHGLEVRVPFCDHRLVEYVWNVPWATKNLGGREKGLLRAAVSDLLPADIVDRPKSMYPGAADTTYARAVNAELDRLLGTSGAPLFDLVDRAALRDAFAADPRLPGTMAVRPSPTAPAAWLLDINEWLIRYRVHLV
jgi:asparagine synthase (glutamine-hydrolysing)